MITRLSEPVTRSLGLAAIIAYAGLIGWLLASQPRSVAEAIGGLSATVGTHDIDAQAFADGIAFFRRDQFIESRSAFARADPASRDARTQFYIAYSLSSGLAPDAPRRSAVSRGAKARRSGHSIGAR